VISTGPQLRYAEAAAERVRRVLAEVDGVRDEIDAAFSIWHDR